MDAALLYADFAVSAVLALLLALFAGIRTLGRLFMELRSNLAGIVTAFVWQDTEEEKDGKTVTVRRLSPVVENALRATIPLVAPVLMAEGLKWAETHLKLPVTTASNGASIIDVANIDPAALMEHLPAKYKKNPLVQLGLPMALRFLAKGRGAAGGGGGGGGNVSTTGNPFTPQ